MRNPLPVIGFVLVLLTGASSGRAQLLFPITDTLQFDPTPLGETPFLDLEALVAGQGPGLVVRDYTSSNAAFIVNAGVKEAQEALTQIDGAYRRYHRVRNEWPESIDELKDVGYLSIPPETEKQWEFALIGGSPIVAIEATSTEGMLGGAGHVILLDFTTRLFSGYFVLPNEPMEAGTQIEFRVHFVPEELLDYEGFVTLYAADADGNEIAPVNVPAFGAGIPSESVRERETLPHPKYFRVLAAYPNPFNGQQKIRFEVARPGEVRLQVFDLNGAQVTTGAVRYFNRGRHELIWNAGRLGSGIYYVQLNSITGESMKQVTLIR